MNTITEIRSTSSTGRRLVLSHKVKVVTWYSLHRPKDTEKGISNYRKIYYLEHREELLNYGKVWRLLHPEYMSNYCKVWRLEYPDYNKVWHLLNPDYRKLLYHEKRHPYTLNGRKLILEKRSV